VHSNIHDLKKTTLNEYFNMYFNFSRNIIFLVFFLSVHLNCIAQIGINTENVKGVFHLDGAFTAATTNPQTGNISALQVSDDVAINVSGNVGVGTIVPSTKLHIVTTEQAEGLRISDTTEGLFRVLVGDSQGVGRWTPRIGAWYAFLNDIQDKTYNPNYNIRQLGPFRESAISSNSYGSVNAVDGSITVPVNGIYRITIGGHWGTNRMSPTQAAIYIAGVIIRVNGTDAWEPNTICYGPGWGVSPTFMEILTLNQDDVITIFTREESDSYSNLVDQFNISVELLESFQN